MDTVFNLYGLPTQVGGYTSLIAYDEYARRVRSEMGPAGSQAGLVTQTLYQDSDGRVSVLRATTRAGQLIQDDTYSYDAPGNPTGIVHHTMWDDETECYRYDTRQRLDVAVTIAGISTCPVDPSTLTPSGPAPYRDTYTNDQLGRITDFDGTARTHGTTAPAGCLTGTPTTKPHTLATSSGAGQADTFTYDCNGAITAQTTSGGPAPGTTTYTWDPRQRLSATITPGGTTTNVYDTTNNRVLRVEPNGTRTVYLGSAEIRYNASSGSVQAARVYGQTRREFNGAITNFAVNHQDTIAAATNDVSPAPVRLRTVPYGQPRTMPYAVPAVDDRNFLGQPADTAGPVIYLVNRYYSTGYGIFLSVDPLLRTGVPASLNGYAYSMGNPVGRFDKDGLEPCPKNGCTSRDSGGRSPCNHDEVLTGCLHARAYETMMANRVTRHRHVTCDTAICKFARGFFVDGLVGTIHTAGGLVVDSVKCPMPALGCFDDDYQPNTSIALAESIRHPSRIYDPCIDNPWRCAGQIAFVVAVHTAARAARGRAPATNTAGAVDRGGLQIAEGNAGHIFRNAPGHLAEDTAANRAIIQSAADSGVLVRTSPQGVQTFRQLLPDGTEAWAEVYQGQITNGGVNVTPRSP